MISRDGGSGVLLALQRATHHTMHTLSDELDLTASEINALANLDGSSRNVRELSAVTGTRATTLTGVLDRLERRGYVIRELDPTDRRSFRLTLTGEGRAAARRVRAAIRDLERRALADVSARHLAGFHAVAAALRDLR